MYLLELAPESCYWCSQEAWREVSSWKSSTLSNQAHICIWRTLLGAQSTPCSCVGQCNCCQGTSGSRNIRCLYDSLALTSHQLQHTSILQHWIISTQQQLFLVFEGPVLGPQKDQGPDHSPGPASVLNGPVLVLNFSGKLRTSPGPVWTGLLPLFNRGSN